MQRALALLVLLGIASSWLACTRPSQRASGGGARGAAVDLTPYFDRNWGFNSLWDDGQAEVAHYAARRMQYRKLREFDAVLITVKEDFNQKYNVKADPPYAGTPLLPVLKLNIVQNYDTEFYPYHFLTSLFLLRANLSQIVKVTSASQEWCGNTFKEVRSWAGSPEMEFHSYFDSEGDGFYPLGLHGGELLEDQLALSLRALRFAPGLHFRTRLLPSLASNRGIPGVWQEVEFSVTGEENFATPAGVIPSWKVVVKTAAGESDYWFEKAAPNILVKFMAYDGREFLLKSRERRVYWPVLR